MPFLNTNIKASLAAIPVHYSLLCALPRSPAAPEATRLSALLRVVLTHCSQIGESGDHQEAPQDYSNHLRLVSTFPFVQDNAAWKLLQMKFNREARTIFAAAWQVWMVCAPLHNEALTRHSTQLQLPCEAGGTAVHFWLEISSASLWDSICSCKCNMLMAQVLKEVVPCIFTCKKVHVGVLILLVLAIICGERVWCLGNSATREVRGCNGRRRLMRQLVRSDNDSPLVTFASKEILESSKNFDLRRWWCCKSTATFKCGSVERGIMPPRCLLQMRLGCRSPALLGVNAHSTGKLCLCRGAVRKKLLKCKWITTGHKAQCGTGRDMSQT